MVDLSPAIKAAESGYEYAVKCGSVEEVVSIVESAKEQFPHLKVHCRPESAESYLERGQKVAVSIGLYRRGEISWASDPKTYVRGGYGKYTIVDYEDLTNSDSWEESERTLDFLFGVV